MSNAFVRPAGKVTIFVKHAVLLKRFRQSCVTERVSSIMELGGSPANDGALKGCVEYKYCL